MVKVITPEQGAELKRLYAEAEELSSRILKALEEGAPVESLRPEREKEAAIYHRINEILGD